MVKSGPKLRGYYSLPKDKRWLDRCDGNSPFWIGGRDTDVGCIGLALKQIIEGHFAGQMPDEIADKLEELFNHLHESERMIEELIGMVSADVGNE